MKVTNLALKQIDMGRQVEVTLKTDDEQLHVYTFGKLIARQLMRGLFLQVGVEPKLGTKKEGSLPSRKPTWLD